jgi:response regulator of citrate/malate metabolism
LLAKAHCYGPSFTWNIGAEFLKDLKGMEKYKHIAVVLLSSSKTPKEIEVYKLMGALEYLVKPNTYQEYVNIAVELKRKMDLN